MITDLKEKLARALLTYLDLRVGYHWRSNIDFDTVYHQPGLRAIEYLTRGEPVPFGVFCPEDVLEFLTEAHALLSVPEVRPEVRASRPMDKNPYVDATTEELLFPGSPEPMSYHLLTIHSPWVLIVATTGVHNDQRVILTTAYRHPTGRVRIEIPAGFMDDQDQSDPLVTGKRELLEETGYGEPTHERVIDSGVTALDGVVRTNGTYVLLEGVSLIRPPQLEGHEQQADIRSHPCHWITVFTLMDAGFITSATTKSALLTAARRLGVLIRHRECF